MRTSVRVFSLPKAGNSAAEYEDAHWPRVSGDLAGEVNLAIADGATETSFSGLWARLLATAYGRGRLADANWSNGMGKIRRVWQRVVGQKPLPWYAEEKLRLGAFSSLAGLTLTPATEPENEGGNFRAMSIGDSCLFQVRRGRLIWSFPYTAAEEFNSRPLLISSLARGPEDEGAVSRAVGAWQSGDVLFLMTDALACWTLRRVETGDDPFAILQSVAEPATFEALIADQSAACDPEAIPVLKNDDVTLVVCEPVQNP